MTVDYPEVFITGKIQYEDSTAGKLHACKDALSAWGNTHAVGPLPENFGKTMSKIAEIVNVTGTPDSFIKKSKELLKQKEKRK